MPGFSCRVLALSCLLLQQCRAVCIDADLRTICLTWSREPAGNITLTLSCTPTPGSRILTWCGIGFSLAGATMVPASATVVQSDASGAVFLEDRDSRVGYQLPPCYARQLSSLVHGARAANGSLTATWTRPVIAAPDLAALGFLSLFGNLTLLGASSSDGAFATVPCDGYMTPHTFVQPGVGPFAFS
jgi:hypothetical protein